MKMKVLLGMSGGIDSFISAVMLLRKGYDVTGVTFIFSGNDEAALYAGNGAKELSDSINIPHFSVDLRKEFNTIVVDYFKKSYQSGTTPFPCAVCNPHLKFKKLKEIADKLQIEYIATGHYAQITGYENVKYIKAGLDPDKDQSFFLWGLSQALLKRILFPLGELHKKDVRALADEISHGGIAKKPESMGLCFTNGLKYREFLIKEGINFKPGNFVDPEGKVLGKHNGIINYTIGQRRGLGLQLNKPLFVSEIRSAKNEVVLSGFNALFKSELFLTGIHFNDIDRIYSEKLFKVRIRYRLQENTCRICILNEKKAVLELQEPVSMVANGQTAVIYDGDCVVGGGFIEISK